jgi:predicted phage-related endonuclease
VTLTAEQKQTRKHGVGGSEVFAALGKDPRCSRLELYLRKLGEMPEPNLDDDERIRFGRLLEPVITQEFARRIGQVVMPSATLVHPTLPLVGTPDGWMPALARGVEIKTADKHEAADFGEPGTDQVPIRYLVQCAGYMALTDAASWYLCVLIGGNDLRIYEIPRDKELESAILAGVSEFWQHVAERKPPNPETPDEVRLRWPKDLGHSITATDEIIEQCAILERASAEARLAERMADEAKAEIQRFMADASQLVHPTGLRVMATWRKAKDSERFDTKRFAVEHPAMHSQYSITQQGSRRFLLK